MKVRIKNPIWGVPITFLNNYCPSQFTIVGFCNPYFGLASFIVPHNIQQFSQEATDINGKPKYFRILIKKVS